jgi:hypothetical protein
MDAGVGAVRALRSTISRLPALGQSIPAMQFIRALRDRIRDGEITTTVRLWQRPHVKVGGRYALPPGEILVTRIFEVSLADVTPELARQSGFVGVVDLLKVAKHGTGRRVFVIEFRYVEPKTAGRREKPRDTRT